MCNHGCAIEKTIPPDSVLKEPALFMFSDAEMKSIILAVLKGRPHGAPESAVDDGIEQVIDWGCKVRTQSLLLDLILSGRVVVSVTPTGEIRFARTTEKAESTLPSTP